MVTVADDVMVVRPHRSELITKSVILQGTALGFVVRWDGPSGTGRESPVGANRSYVSNGSPDSNY